MTRIIEDIEAHYETHEVPFGRIYEWHPEHIILECDCGERLALTGQCAITTCRRCGADYGVVVHDIQGREGRLRDKISHPWHYDAKAQAEQHLRDEAAHPKGSSWRYDDDAMSGDMSEE